MDTISIVGIGRLGICAALCFANAGYSVVGVDINKEYVQKINSKQFISDEPYVNAYLQSVNNFKASTNIIDAINHSDYIYIIVDTPTTAQYNYDTKNLETVLMSLNSHKIENKHIIIGCTVLPGYIDNKAKPFLSDCQNVSISYNPEFIRQGSIITDFQNPDMILIGQGCQQVGDYLQLLYLSMCFNKPKIHRMSPSSAEICKLAVNCFITTKISYANMIGDIADQTPNADKYDILQAVGDDSRVGSRCLTPGYGFGGPCFPRDNRALGYYASLLGIKPLLPVATDEMNKLHTEYQTKKLLDQNKEKYIFSDLAYKPDCSVPIIEESQKLKIAVNLAKAGKKVIIHDYDSIVDVIKKEFGDLFDYQIIIS